jgi:hypothetical protein
VVAQQRVFGRLVHLHARIGGEGEQVLVAAQFGEGEVDYKAGKLSRFLTKMPSNRAKTIMTRLGTKLLNLGEK